MSQLYMLYLESDGIYRICPILCMLIWFTKPVMYAYLCTHTYLYIIIYIYIQILYIYTETEAVQLFSKPMHVRRQCRLVRTL
jgi:hypothetical protein